MNRSQMRRLWVSALVLASVALGADKVALTMKAAGDTKLRTQSAPPAPLAKGTALFDGDHVLTKNDGVAVVVYLDDKSQLKIKGDSDVQITGKRGAMGISKQAYLSGGTVKASVTEQKGEFVVSTPTSVASVKGTEFWLTSGTEGDLLISLSGSVQYTNTVSGETITTDGAMVVEASTDGSVTVLITVKVSGEATSAISGGQFGMTNLSVVEGDVASGDLSGAILIGDNTVVEGAAVAPGMIATVTGILDPATGNLEATLIEVAEMVTIEATATSGVTAGVFAVGNVTVVSGEVDGVPSGVRITSATAVTGPELVAGALITATGLFNAETGVLDATQLNVTIPELRISGIVSNLTDTGFELTSIAVLEGAAEAGSLSGRVIVTDETAVEGAELAVGARVTVVGSANAETGDVIASRVVVAQVAVLATIQTAPSNNEFEVSNISVIEGEVDPSTLSGIVRLTPNTTVEGGEIAAGYQATITGTVDASTGAIVASKVVVIVAEREMIFEMEDAQGRRRELIIKFQ